MQHPSAGFIKDPMFDSRPRGRPLVGRRALKLRVVVGHIGVPWLDEMLSFVMKYPNGPRASASPAWKSRARRESEGLVPVRQRQACFQDRLSNFCFVHCVIATDDLDPPQLERPQASRYGFCWASH